MQLMYAFNTRFVIYYPPASQILQRHIPDKNVCVGTASLTSAGLKQGCTAQRKRHMVSVR